MHRRDLLIFHFPSARLAWGSSECVRIIAVRARELSSNLPRRRQQTVIPLCQRRGVKFNPYGRLRFPKTTKSPSASKRHNHWKITKGKKQRTNLFFFVKEPLQWKKEWIEESRRKIYDPIPKCPLSFLFSTTGDHYTAVTDLTTACQAAYFTLHGDAATAHVARQTPGWEVRETEKNRV